MENILKKISETAQVAFLKPADEKVIIKTEERLGVKLPEDYKTFLQITNGFPTTDETVDPTFLPIEEIDYLKDIETYTIEAFSVEGIEKVGKQLSNSILIAGKDEEQYFLLIPPTKDSKNWKYWKFAHWIPGEEEHINLEAYFKDVLEFIEEID